MRRSLSFAESRVMRTCSRVTAYVTFALLATGCASNLFLPDPPPREDWAHHSLRPGQAEEESEDNFGAARTAIFGFLDAMAEEDYATAYSMLSNDTRIVMDQVASNGLGETVLSEAAIHYEGEIYPINVVDFFVVDGLQRIEDEYDGAEESETARRKELFAIAADGTVHRVVVIREGSEWHIHRPDFSLAPGEPGRRGLDS
ncbi:MAG: hypothetical protein KC561_04155 [Myxococcales bacterium]|nr:hypothetical protein [Myxococcales bacterium]